jgi:hypothetical protein
LDEKILETSRKNGKTSESVSKTMEYSGGFLVIMVSSIGADLFYPMIHLFLIIKTVNNFKFINAEFGEIQENFLAQISNYFQPINDQVGDQNEKQHYKTRGSLDKHKVPILSL